MTTKEQPIIKPNAAPILEFDPTREAVIEPGRVVKPADLPERCVICFFKSVLDRRSETGKLQKRSCLKSEMGENPIYVSKDSQPEIAILQPGVGAPIAAGFLEEIIAKGCRKFIVIGSCGVLDPEIPVGQLIIPIAAVRDEGTSYHYLPASREAFPDLDAVQSLISFFDREGINYQLGKTWTTDAFYRETPEKVKLRRAEGCLTVEMEASAFFAVAEFRSVSLVQILYGGDDVSGIDWDSRQAWSRQDVREGLLELALQASREIW